MQRLREVRRSAGSRLVQGFFQGAAELGRLHPVARPERHGVEVLRDIPYRGARGRREHRLDVYRPRDLEAPAPVVLYIHGGAFRILSKDTHWVMGLGFARRGYVVLNVDYRLAPTHPFPAALEDVAAAYLFALEHAADYGGDPSRIIVAGESAGANLAASLSLQTLYERPEPFAREVYAAGVVPRAVLPACGVFQVSDMSRYARRKPGFPRFILERFEEMERGYLGANPRAHGAALELADVLSWLESAPAPSRPLPAYFLPVGTKDPLLDDTRRLRTALAALGAPVEARYYEGGIHAFHAFVFLEQARRCWRDQFDFLERHLESSDGD